MAIRDDPKFGTTIDEPVWFLSHPLAPDDKFTFQQNMDHVLELMNMFYSVGLRVICPWHTMCLCLDDNDPEMRRIGLEVDCFVANAIGRIVLTGHKLSSGMECELASVMKLGQNGRVLNFVGWRNDAIRTYLSERSGRLLKKV